MKQFGQKLMAKWQAGLTLSYCCNDQVKKEEVKNILEEMAEYSDDLDISCFLDALNSTVLITNLCLMINNCNIKFADAELSEPAAKVLELIINKKS